MNTSHFLGDTLEEAVVKAEDFLCQDVVQLSRNIVGFINGKWDIVVHWTAR